MFPRNLETSEGSLLTWASSPPESLPLWMTPNPQNRSSRSAPFAGSPEKSPREPASRNCKFHFGYSVGAIKNYEINDALIDTLAAVSAVRTHRNHGRPRSRRATYIYPGSQPIRSSIRSGRQSRRSCVNFLSVAARRQSSEREREREREREDEGRRSGSCVVAWFMNFKSRAAQGEGGGGGGMATAIRLRV